MKKYNVESFNLDHTKITAPFVRTASQKTGPRGDTVTKFDIRFTQPNKDFLQIDAIHTLEHLVAEYIRDEIDGVIDFSPMGCRTGFYLTLFGNVSESTIAEKMSIVLSKVAAWDDSIAIPGTSPVECENYKSHNLKEAKEAAQKWVNGIKETGFNCYK